MLDVTQTIMDIGFLQALETFGNYYLFNVFIFSFVGLFSIASFFKSGDILSPMAIIILASLYVAVPTEFKYLFTLLTGLTFGIIFYKLVQKRQQ